MGLTVTKFRQALERGAENEAMDLFVRHQNLKRAVRVNRSFGSKHGENTALHYVCAYGMESLLQDLLAEGANPLSKNANGQTAFHLVNESDGRDALKRLKCLKLMLTWLRENEGNEPVSKLSIEKIVDKVSIFIFSFSSFHFLLSLAGGFLFLSCVYFYHFCFFYQYYVCHCYENDNDRHKIESKDLR